MRKLKEVYRLSNYLRDYGCTVQIQRPDSQYRLYICSSRPGYTIATKGTLQHVLDVLQAVIFGIELGKNSGASQA